MDNKTAVEAFRNKWSTFDSYTTKLEDLILSLLKGENIDFHLVEKRTKSVESFESKISRKNEKYGNALSEITDISGLRVILYYNDHVEKIDRIIRDNFIVDEKNTVDKRTILDEDQFGYQSYHYVIQLNDSRSSLPEWKIFKDLIAEIQVRTVMQHAWASISHQLEYKKDYEIPSLLKRKLFRLASLVELADEEFQVVRNEHAKISKAIINREIIDNTEIFNELNLNTVSEYFAHPNKLMAEISKALTLAGFTVQALHGEHEDRSKSDLLFISRLLGIKDLQMLESFLRKHLKAMPGYYKLIYDSYGMGQWITDLAFGIVLILMNYLTEEQRMEYRKSSNWSDGIWGMALTAIDKFQKLNNI